MIRHIAQPTIIQAAGNKPKRIEEFFGRVNSQTTDLSLARMKSPGGWEEPGQTPEFDEYSVVLHGMLRVQTKTDSLEAAYLALTGSSIRDEKAATGEQMRQFVKMWRR